MSQRRTRRIRNARAVDSDDDDLDIMPQGNSQNNHNASRPNQSQRSVRNNYQHTFNYNDDDSDDDISPQRSQTRRRNGTTKVHPSTSQATQNDDYDFSLSQRSQSSQRKEISEEEMNQLVNKVVRYLFKADRSKLPVLRIHIIKEVLENNSKHFKQIMLNVKSALESSAIGYNLLEYESGKYIITNKVDNRVPHMNFPPQDGPKLVLLYFILAHIFMSENECKEESIWKFLKTLTIIRENHFEHEYFGDVYRLVTVEFVKQLYLRMTKVENSDPPTNMFSWGVRAEHEVSKLQVLEFVTSIYKNRSIESWAVQYRAAQESERERRAAG
ncbi:non-structural maintenance of chromosomes element 3 homolog [Orussus abietinus]|uniref:non-structural maintenance of chromosomes element 3 homolog n=1 Tax=Orussus abietinus TaxID=222816 RepID=UPI000625D342|nr:non-structural maintenance of chromosomes element 3 homolog [Orussus abietinus]XP_023289547.1 non-structural maintenance of chromosomes element 3 homolog [Orussus abietinus]